MLFTCLLLSRSLFPIKQRKALTVGSEGFTNIRIVKGLLLLYYTFFIFH